MSSGLTITRHAALRYRERVKPGLDLGVAARELAALVQSPKVIPRPSWVRYDGRAAAWIEIADGIVGAVVLDEEGRLVMTTVQVRAGLSEGERIHLTRAKRHYRAARRSISRDRGAKTAAKAAKGNRAGDRRWALD